MNTVPEESEQTDVPDRLRREARGAPPTSVVHDAVENASDPVPVGVKPYKRKLVEDKVRGQAPVKRKYMYFHQGEWQSAAAGRRSRKVTVDREKTVTQARMTPRRAPSAVAGEPPKDTEHTDEGEEVKVPVKLPDPTDHIPVGTVRARVRQWEERTSQAVDDNEDRLNQDYPDLG